MANSKKVLLFIADYTDQGKDSLYLYSEGLASEVDFQAVVVEVAEIICHDYWLIAPVIYRETKRLPACVTDVDELRITSSGRRNDRKSRDKLDISNLLLDFVDVSIVERYKNIFTRRVPVDLHVLNIIGAAMLSCYENIEKKAQDAGELERFLRIERPVSNYLVRSAAAGIAVNSERLKFHKDRIEFDYYMALKKFSAQYCMPLEVPSDRAVVDYLEPRGFDFSGVNVQYVLDFVPMRDSFAVDLLNLRKIDTSRKVLSAIPYGAKRIFPIVDGFGSVTSRIYFKDPSLQNLAKRHRDILMPDPGKSFSYIDYEQYEAGIMAALSSDANLLRLYAAGDLYMQAAEEMFPGAGRRKEAKRLFLSYAYGMKKRNILDAAGGYGAERSSVKKFFDQFSRFEEWKLEVEEKFFADNRIGTSLGNYLNREQAGVLSDREKRSAVSQVVQGTASLIFKKALLELERDHRIELQVPMHDAVLFQHPLGFSISDVEMKLSTVMSEHFGGVIVGKASVAVYS